MIPGSWVRAPPAPPMNSQVDSMPLDLWSCGSVPCPHGAHTVPTRCPSAARARTSWRTHCTEPVDRLVEDERPEAAQEGGGDAQALAHAEGEPSDALGGDPGQAGHLDDLADPGGLDVVGGGRGAQV